MIYGGTKRLLVACLILGLAALSMGCPKAKPGGSMQSARGHHRAKETRQSESPDAVVVPFFLGGDVATFYANGGPETTPDSLFGKQGLKLKPSLATTSAARSRSTSTTRTTARRSCGTMSMLGQESEGLTNLKILRRWCSCK